MLDDESAAALAYTPTMVLGVDFFALMHSVRRTPNRRPLHALAIDLSAVNILQQYSRNWQFIFAYENELDLEVYDRVGKFAIPFIGTISPLTHDLDAIAKIIQSADVVYAPTFCQQHRINPRLQPPSDTKTVCSVLTFFGVSLTPFSPESYYTALGFYDPATDSRSGHSK